MLQEEYEEVADYKTYVCNKKCVYKYPSGVERSFDKNQKLSLANVYGIFWFEDSSAQLPKDFVDENFTTLDIKRNQKIDEII